MERHEPERPVLQLVRPPDRREAHHLAAERRAADADPVVGRQRLARDRPEGRRIARARGGGARPAHLRQHGLRLLLPARGEPDRLPLRAGHRRAPCCYDTIVSESRIASYIGIAKGELPAKEYFGAWRTFPDTCDWSWQETKPLGVHRTYLGVDVFEGAYPYAGPRRPRLGRQHVRGADALAVRARGGWAPRSWGVNHPLTVARRSTTGSSRPGTATGASPVQHARGRLRRVRRGRARPQPGGLQVERGNTLVDPGFEGCPAAPASPIRRRRRTRTAWSPRTRRSSPCAGHRKRRWQPPQAPGDFAIYDRWGFRDSVNVDTGVVSGFYLSLDQAIIMAAIGNALDP